MRKQVIAAMLSMAVASIAAAQAADSNIANSGIAADAISTGAALSVPGAVEMNPLGWATVPLRMLAVQKARQMPREEGQPVMDAISASSWGAAANNLLVLAGIGSAAPVIGIAVSYAVWKSGETEREFWGLCAVHQRLNPGTKCEFRKWAADETARIAQADVSRQMVAARANEVLVMAPVAKGL